MYKNCKKENTSVETDANGKSLNKQKQIRIYLDVDSPTLYTTQQLVTHECIVWNAGVKNGFSDSL